MEGKELYKQLDEIQESLTNTVIIDGVDVAGCKDFLEPDGCDNTDCISFQCDKNYNCQHKQLKRLEQENKELRQQYNCYACDTCQGKEDYRNMKRHCKNAIKTVHTYRSALEEILESAKFAQCLPCGSGNLEDCLNCSDETTNNGQFCMKKRIHEIKTKCVEVLND